MLPGLGDVSLANGTVGERLRVGFVMEQVLGHVTWYQNLRSGVDANDRVDARWVQTTMFNPSGVIERVPGLPPFLRSGARALLDTRRGLRGWRADVLLFNTQKAAAFCQWEMLRTPTILMTDVTPLQLDAMAPLYDHPVDGSGFLRDLKHRANVLNFRLAAAVIPCSRWAGDSLVRDYGVAPDRIHVIPIGCDTDYWRPPDVPRGVDRSHRVQLLFVGGHFERKGGRLLLDAFRDLRLHERADLHIVTRTPAEAIPATPGVTVHQGVQNNSSELLRLYQRADVFVLPTLADCFSNASIEALATGLPVVATALAGIPDIIEHERTGFLLEPGDGRQLGSALARLVDEPTLRHAFGAAARAFAVRRLSARTNAGRILDVAQGVRSDWSRSRRRAS